MLTARRIVVALVTEATLALACSSSGTSPPADSGTRIHDGSAIGDVTDTGDVPSTGDGTTDADVDGGPSLNVAPVIVDNGPSGLMVLNTLYTTVTLCRPGTTICQTIDHIEVDTGSTGVRIIASVLNTDLMLPQAMAANGNPLVECYQSSEGVAWTARVDGG